MFGKILRAVGAEVSAGRAYELVAEITRYHRVQGSPGFRQAVQAVASRLNSSRLRVEILSFPADGHRYWGYRPDEEWDCSDAELHLLEPDGPRRLASWQESKFSLIQRSAPTPPEGRVCQLVAVEDPEDPSSYEELDLAGKAVMVSGDLELIRRLAAARGAVGLVTDTMREFPPVRQKWDLADELPYTSFWWVPGEHRLWGFVVSPRAGEELRGLLRRAGSAGLPIRARVRSRFYPGSLEVLSAFLPGTGPQEVWLVAHLCHPQPSANDNASGAATAAESLLALDRLIKEKILSRPRRGIRLLLVPEINGTICYLATHPETKERAVAALNLDMVGQRQDLCGSVLHVESGPLATPAYPADLLCLILREALQEGSNFADTARLPALRWTTTPFSGGSDHCVLGDPSVGIPCPMLIQWPDRFYHTSADTLDKVDPGVLRRLAIAAATYAYFLADAHLPEAAWLAGELLPSFASTLHRSTCQLLDPSLTAFRSGEQDPRELASALRRAEEVIGFRLQRKIADLAALEKLLEPSEVEAYRRLAASLEEECLAIANREQCRAKTLLETLCPGFLPRLASGSRYRPPDPAPPQRLIPRRLLPGPLTFRHAAERLPQQDITEFLQFRLARKKTAHLLEPLLLYWSNGQRTLAEIERLVEWETGVRDSEYALRFLELLARSGLLALDPG